MLLALWGMEYKSHLVWISSSRKPAEFWSRWGFAGHIRSGDGEDGKGQDFKAAISPIRIAK